jgi:electron transfer flavoprotein alpha/beta subunit
MCRVAVIIGSYQDPRAAFRAAPTLPRSDRAAIGLALQRFAGLVEAYCLRDDTEALRYALAAGAATARPLDDLAAFDFDVVLVGHGGAEPYGDLLLALLAEQKQCAMVFDVLDIVSHPESLTVTRDLGRGSREVLTLHGPAVLGIAEEATQLLYVSRYRRQMARPPRFNHAGLPPDPLAALSSAWEPARPRGKTVALAARTEGSANARLQALLGMTVSASEADNRAHVIVADATTCARHLVRFLRHHGIIPASETALPDAVTPAAAVLTSPRPPAKASVEAPWRGPRPLSSDAGGLERLPHPMSAAPGGAPEPHGTRPARAPRPVGAPTRRRGRGPRPIDHPPDASST